MNRETNLLGFIPALAWLRRYPRQWLRADVTAGLIAAAVVIPKAMAFATIAGLPVQVGLDTVFVPMVIYALLGTSRPLSVSTTTTLAILAAAELSEAVPSGGAVGIAASALFGLPQAGVETVGSVPRELPSLVWPQLHLAAQMWPGAVGIALMSFTESIAAARAFAKPEEARPLPNQELLALGAANVAGGLFGAMPAGGGTTQTAVNRSAGARTQMAELVTAAAALATLLFLAPLLAFMPNSVLAAAVLVY